MTDTKTPHIELTWDEAGQMHMLVEGEITHDHLIIGAFYLTRTASGIVDAILMRGEDTDERARKGAAGIIPIRASMQDVDRAVKGH